MQACVEFFTERLVNQALTRHAVQALERGGNHHHMIVRLTARPRSSMARVLCGLIRQDKVKRRKSLTKLRFHALGARKMRIGVCQFLVRLTSGAHTR